MKKYLKILVYSLLHFFANAQNPVSRNITNQNGLPSNTVYNILQDKKGFIWLGHDKGLSRYDGSTFTNYTAPAQQGKSVSNLLEINNTIWCQDFSGNFYYTKNETLIKENNFKTNGAYTPAGVLNENILSFINYDLIKTYNIKLAKSFVYKKEEQTKQAVFHHTNASYFFSNQSLKKFDGNKIETINTFIEALPNFTFLLKVDNQFLAFTRNIFPLVYKIDGGKVEPSPALKKGLLIQDVALIENEIWISTTSGAFCFNKQMQPLYNGACFFSENSITKIIKDRENNYWFGTLNKGILVVPDINVKLFKYGNETITALSSYNNNEVLAGTSSNLIFSFNSQKNTFNTLVSNETKGEIFSLFFDEPLQQIVSCANGISFYKNGIKVKEEALAGKAITPINNETYVAAFAGGITFLARQQSPISPPNWLSQYVTIVKEKAFLTEGFRGRTTLFDSTSQTLFTATAEGLKYYNKSTSNIVLLNNQPIYASSLCMLNGKLYAGTFSDGVVKIENYIASLLNNKNYKIASTVYKLYPENYNLWISSDELIQRYNTITSEVVNYTSADGLPKAEIKDILVQNGKTYLATTDGLVVFNSNKNAINTVKPLLQLNKLLVNNQPFSIDSSIKLKSNENNIELIFSVLSFKENAIATINYRINNEKWKTLPKGIRSLQLAELAPGKYSIEIKAENEDGIAAEKNIVINFFIATPFYKKIWFFILVASGIITGIYFYFKQRLKSVQKSKDLLSQKMKLEQELHQSMLSSIKSQMNPHFLFNALNTIQSYIYTNEKENASLYLGKFSELTRTILDMSNKERVSLAEEIKSLQLYVELEQLRFEDKLQYTFDIDKKISTETTYIPSMLIQPYIENAIKHGLMHKKDQWKLSILFQLKNNTIEVTIDDNGVGRKASTAINQQRNKQHQSFASNANEKRLDILNKGLSKCISLHIVDKVDEHGYALGTTMILNIPFI